MAASLEFSGSVWPLKDPLPRELQFLQPLNAAGDQFARVMVGQRQIAFAQDAAAQTLAASGATVVSLVLNTISAGVWTAPPAGVGVLIEAMRANIITQDASGKLVVTLPLLLGTAPNINGLLGSNAAPMPFTMPAVSGVQYEIRLVTPTLPYLPTDGSFASGPNAQIGLLNTDGAGAHTYKRTLVIHYRYIYDIDYTKERVYVAGTLR